MSLSPSTPQPGDVIAGKYQVVSLLGAADASVVFLAEQAGADEMVALHWYESGPAGRHASALTEARLTALAHLPQRCGFRVRESLETREAHYLVTAWQAGESLEARLTRVGPQPIAEVSRLLLPCIRAAHTAYLAGIVQHTIKTTTIYVCDPTADRAEHAKLLDFELDQDRVLQPMASAIGMDGDVQPTAAARGVRADPRAAVRAFGAIMYRALTGLRHTPFDKPMRATAHTKFAPPPLLPPIVRWFLERTLSDTCEEPFNTLEELAAALESMSAALPQVSVRMSTAQAHVPDALGHQPMPLLPASFAATTAPQRNLPSPVIRPWATTMRLPRALYAVPKAAPTRLPFAWIIAAGALVVTAGALALRHDPRSPGSSSTPPEEEVASYNAATSYDAAKQRAPENPEPGSWRGRVEDLPIAALPLAALAPALQPTAAPSVLKRANLSPIATQPPPPPAARNPRQRTRAFAPLIVSRSAGKANSQRALPATDRNVRSPNRGRAPMPKERAPLPPESYPRPMPAARQTAESGALDSMGLL